jgi:membrane protein
VAIAIRAELKKTGSLLRQAFLQWRAHKVSRLAASLACYTIISAAPIVALAVAIAGWAFGEKKARGEIAGQIGSVVGDRVAQAIEAIVRNARDPSSGGVGLIWFAVLLFGASRVFAELQHALNTIWGVAAKPGRGVLGVVRDRSFYFGMVMTVAFLLLASLVVSASLHATGQFLSAHFPGGATLAHVLDFAVSLGTVTLLFALVFKMVPEAEIAWGDVWLGALLTAVCFEVGKQLLGLYVSRSGKVSSFGAAGSLVALVLWIYYTSQLVFFGAEFTRAHAERAGRCARATRHSVVIDRGSCPSLPA